MADLTKDAKIDYIPTFDNMILPTVQALFALEGTASIQEPVSYTHLDVYKRQV